MNEHSKRAGHDVRKNKGSKVEAAEAVVLKCFFSAGLVAVVFGLSLALWHHLVKAPRLAEPSPPVPVQGDSPLYAARQSLPGVRVAVREIDYASTDEKRQLEGVWIALLAAQSIGDLMEQEAALNRGVDGITPEMAAILLAGLMPEELKGTAARRLFDRWATASPGGAAVWAQGQVDPETRQSFMYLAALRWAVSDLSEAAGWARNLPEGDSRAAIMAAVGLEAVRSDPLEALRLGVELPAGAPQTQLVVQAAAEWAAKDRDGAIEWAGQIKDQALRQQVVEHVAVASAEQDPVGAANVALQQMSPGEQQDRAVVSILQRWVQTDPASASAWVGAFPASALGRDAMGNLVNLWADRDLAASGNWLLTLPAGELQRTGILAYARVLRRTDPALAERWASSVTADVQ